MVGNAGTATAKDIVDEQEEEEWKEGRPSLHGVGMMAMVSGVWCLRENHTH